MHSQCFPPTLRECAFFRNHVLLDHVFAEYGLGYSVWFLDIFFLLSVVHRHTVLPERLAMMLVAVEVGHVVGHILSISLVQ